RGGDPIAPSVATAAAPEAPSADGEPPGQAPTRGPSLQEFLADRSILIVSYVGALLLVTATLLFELYGPAGLSGSARFAAVLAVGLGSRAYAVLSTVALAIGWYAAADALGLLPLGGVALVPLVAVHAAVAFRGDRVALPRALFGAPAVAMTHVAAVAAVLTTY